MRKILDLGYKNLPHHLRTCLLYLGVYPEDHIIKMDDLIRQWIAEGFVSNLHGQDLEDVAESYFNDLINRSLIQLERNDLGELSCRVHDMMLDLIIRRSAEENFVCVSYNSQDVVARLNLHGYKIRRLSLINFSSSGVENGGVNSWAIASGLSQVRTLALLGDFKDKGPSLLMFKYLRVLVVASKHAWGVDLSVIGKLIQLRYLRIAAPCFRIKLPTESQGLKHLETLEIDETMSVSIPPCIVHLPRLSHMIFPKGTGLPDGIGNMKSLRTLGGFNPFDRTIEALGDLTNLRDLSLFRGSNWVALPPFADSFGDFMMPEGDNHDRHLSDSAAALVRCLGKLRKLRSFELDSYDLIEDDHDWLGLLSDPPLSIERLILRGWQFTRIPRWINGDLHVLSTLVLHVKETFTEEVGVLGELPSLVFLSLHVLHMRHHRDGAIIEFGAGFAALEHLDFHGGGDAMSYLGFQAGAMPKLRRLALHFDEWDWGSTTPAGMEHLLSLQHIQVRMAYDMRGGSRYTGTTDSRAGCLFSDYATCTQAIRPSPFTTSW